MTRLGLVLRGVGFWGRGFGDWALIVKIEIVKVGLGALVGGDAIFEANEIVAAAGAAMFLSA